MLKKWVPFWVVPLLVVFATGTVWVRLALIRMTYKIGQINREMDHIRQNREIFQLKLAALRSPRRLEVLARTKFGFSKPRTDQVVHMKNAEIIGYGPEH